MTKVGIIGTGMLGEAVGLHLLESKYEVIVYNRTKHKVENLVKHGAMSVDTPKNVAEKSDIVITVVKDASAVNDVAFGKNGIIYGVNSELVVADMSTINPNSAKEISQKFSDSGISFLEIPVMGGPNVAINGELVMMVSGKKQIYEKFKNIFDIIAKKTFFLGDSGTAHSIKLAMNLQIAMLALSLSEGITLTRKAGFDPEIFLKILNSTYFKTGMSEKKAYKMIKDNFEPTFTLQNLKKDLDTINNTAKSLGTHLSMANQANEIYQNAVDAGFGEIDYTGILAYLKKNSE
ncbi:MAG TPA: NAD(P)-dependent oxidoreductase [Candidatus Nitrosopelagicus sp.]|nr:NAD(P)-dependent oxidoreductase [Candidatus Nitrosopelagicus sp.]